ncbi:MAG: hypothetical protein J0M19_12300 [Sphingomonadales bacterium]|nr:hypothetical protein [Sphingomonadales bacterium]
MKKTADPGERPIKVLITKIGFDGHDRGSRAEKANESLPEVAGERRNVGVFHDQIAWQE